MPPVKEEFFLFKEDGHTTAEYGGVTAGVGDTG